MMKQILFVGVGGAAGSILRFAANSITAKYYTSAFPAATFMVNVAGCFFAGLIFGLTVSDTAQNQSLRMLLITGFCGGFTTFSAFALENVRLMSSGNTMLAMVYTIGSVLAGLIAVWIGLLITR